jgi:uncharacterized protein DUF4190
VSTHPQEPGWPHAGGPFQPEPAEPWAVPSYGSPPYAQAGQYGHPAPYGAPLPPGYGYPPPHPGQQTPGAGLGIAGFVTGLLGLLTFWIPGFGVLLAIVGIVLSAIGMSQIRRAHGNAGLAIAGLVCGVIGVLLFVVLLLSAVAGSAI